MPEVCLVFLNAFASDTWDRTSYELDHNSTLAVENVARNCPNTIVVAHSAGINTYPWANNPNFIAILVAGLPGQEPGNAIVDVLWGDINPCGRLPFTIPATESDYNIPIINLSAEEVTSPGAWQTDFSEGQFIDYRHFDQQNIEPLFEFGFGLGYTTFELQSSVEVSEMEPNVTARPDAEAEILPGGNADLWKPLLSLNSSVTNAGEVVGATVAQLYMSFPNSTVPEGTPVKVLRGFVKSTLQPGESSLVSFELLRRDLSSGDVVSQEWVIPTRAFTFHVGFSSRDIKATVEVEIVKQ
jgi:beta-glucosidase